MTNLANLQALYDKSTKGPYFLNRYEHGGGRFYVESPRALVADFYDEADRELFAEMHAVFPELLAVAMAAKEVIRVDGEIDRYVEEGAASGLSISDLHEQSEKANDALIEALVDLEMGREA